ncbi:uncharacterized protein LOC135696120 [Rhopilema esculentum]|uniref:uncharacterized protein LOC135696120 n=1 Tax=Rhopilema esculentum TaxID=499914 RepID=UPI0031D0BFF3|eukprot:gene12275-2917_t
MEAKTSSPANPWFSEDQLGELEEQFSMVASFFNVMELYEDQKNALRSFFRGKDLYYSSATGSGKSLIFQCIPPLIDLLRDQALGTSTVLVISPLKSLMLDQVNKLQQSAVSAAAIYNGQSQSVLDRIVDGQVSLVYISPEDLLDHEFWRSVLKSECFRRHCEVVVVDEAHCIVHWGLPGGGKEGTGVPFRQWFGNLIEIKSLLNNPRLAVFTATASKSTKGKIFSTLQLDPLKTFEIEKCPLKPNLKFITKFLDSGLPIENVFSVVITDIKSRQDQAKGTLIFCRTRKQCSLIYRTMVDSLGSYLYKDGIRIPQMRLVEMYHAGTPEQVKEHILKTVTSQFGHIRVLICTIAFGMGIDCHYMTQVVHYGGSSCIESYLQECGRAGRRGEDSLCILLYNGHLVKHSNDDMKEYIYSRDCRRKRLLREFSHLKESKEVLHGCNCCDCCAQECECYQSECLGKFNLMPHKGDSEDATVGRKRNVTPFQTSALKQQLESYKQCHLVNGLADVKPVTYPNIHLEFTNLQVSQVLKHCDKIFSTWDIKKYVEIWNDIHANNILLAIHDVFSDFDLDKNALILTELEDITEEIVDVDNENSFWEIKDCTNSSSIFDSMEETYQNERSQNISGGSDIFTEAAEQICSKFD